MNFNNNNKKERISSFLFLIDFFGRYYLFTTSIYFASRMASVMPLFFD